ncbi:MAG TPA: FtsX-like permease family protein, partial [Bryobacteraceae bacterium]|nr:FtsX-like permease family protein [Bryobacteraceae bacterium]
LLIACLNVANLLLGSALARARETAVHMALGSGRVRLIRQLLTEALLLALLGGACGILLAWGAVRYFRYANPIEMPVGADVSIRLPVLGFTLLLSVTTALAFGLAPAWRGANSSLPDGLRAAGRGAVHGGGQGLARVLIASELALSLVLLAGASLLMQSVLRMGAAPLGFEPAHLLVTDISLPEQRYRDPGQRHRFGTELAARLNSMPGVEGAAMASTMPPFGSGNYEMQVEGRERTRVQDVGQDSVTPNYFHVLKIAQHAGRIFDSKDGLHAIVNEALVREYFPEANPIGQRVRTFGFETGPWVTIIGVVANEKHPELMHEMSWAEQPMLYRPFDQDTPGWFSIAVRSSTDGSPDLANAIIAVDKTVPIAEISTMTRRLGAYLRYPQFRAMVIGVFAGLSLFLATIGLHGLLSQYVSQRTQEIGVRMALGAGRWNVIRLIALRAGGAIFAGLAVGLGLTLATSRYLTSLLFGIEPTDVLTVATVSATLIIVGALAILIPARRAVQVDPMVALRQE